MLIDKTYIHMKHFENDKTERKNLSTNKKMHYKNERYMTY